MSEPMSKGQTQWPGDRSNRFNGNARRKRRHGGQDSQRCRGWRSIAALVFSGVLSAPARPWAHGHGRVLATTAAATVPVHASARSLPPCPFTRALGRRRCRCVVRVWEKLNRRVLRRPAVTSFERLRDGVDHSIRLDGHVTSSNIADQAAVGCMGS